jgi:hypothetical protein
MESSRFVGRLGMLVTLVCLVCLTGCASTYMQNRGNDVAQVMNLGVTTSATPQFAMCLSAFGLVTVGYSDFDGTMHGLVDQHITSSRARNRVVGLGLWSYEQYAWGDKYNPEDQKSPAPWRSGAIGVITGPRAPKEETLDAPKQIHLGWVGITWYCRFGQMGDFLAGWFGFDPMGDDTASEPAKAVEPPAGLKAVEPPAAK